jgi:hypothetical protein
VNVTKLQVATAAADAFLTIAAAQQTVVAARAGVERARVLNDVISTLAKNELRPGADASRSRAELALAQTQQIQAEQAVAVARAALAQLLGTKPESIVIEPGPLLQAPAARQVPDAAGAQHPLAVAKEAVVTEVKARESPPLLSTPLSTERRLCARHLRSVDLFSPTRSVGEMQDIALNRVRPVFAVLTTSPPKRLSLR